MALCQTTQILHLSNTVNAARKHVVAPPLPPPPSPKHTHTHTHKYVQETYFNVSECHQSLLFTNRCTLY